MVLSQATPRNNRFEANVAPLPRAAHNCMRRHRSELVAVGCCSLCASRGARGHAPLPCRPPTSAELSPCNNNALTRPGAAATAAERLPPRTAESTRLGKRPTGVHSRRSNAGASVDVRPQWAQIAALLAANVLAPHPQPDHAPRINGPPGGRAPSANGQPRQARMEGLLGFRAAGAHPHQWDIAPLAPRRRNTAAPCALPPGKTPGGCIAAFRAPRKKPRYQNAVARAERRETAEQEAAHRGPPRRIGGTPAPSRAARGSWSTGPRIALSPRARPAAPRARRRIDKNARTPPARPFPCRS